MKIDNSDLFKIFTSFDSQNNKYFYFNGVAFCEDRVFIGATSEVYKNIESAIEGRFFAASINGTEKKFWTDNTGQELIFYYSCDKVWAVSNSFRKLAIFLRKKEVELTVNYGALFPFAVQHSSSQGLMTNNTIINEISILGAEQFLETCGDKLKVVERAEPDSEKDFSLLVTDFINKWASRLRSIVEKMPEETIICDLTGGVDSRIIFALLLASGCDLKKISFNCNEKWEEDFQVAKIIAEKYGLSLNKSKRRPHYSINHSIKLENFLDSYLGVYHGAYFSNYENFSSGAIHIHGGGGGLIRSVYSHDPSNLLLSKNSNFPSPLSHEKSMLELVDFNEKVVEPSSNTNFGRSIKYYFETRNRYHFGRNSYKSLSSYLITPLISQDVLKLSRCSEGLKDRDLYIAIFLLTDPSLIQIEFDDEKKQFNSDRVASVKRKLGSCPINTFKNLDVNIVGGWPKKEVNKQFMEYKKIAYKEELIGFANDYILDSDISNMLSRSVYFRISDRIKNLDLSALAIRDYLYLYLLGFAKDTCSNFPPSEMFSTIRDND